MASLVSSSLKTGRLIFIWSPGSWQEHRPWCGCLDPPNLLDIDDTDDKVDTVLLLLLNPWSDKSEAKLLLSLTSVPASLGCMASFLLSCPRPKPGHLPSFGVHWEVSWSWGHVLVMEIEWHRCRWIEPRATRPPWFDVSFSDGLGDQLPAIPYAYGFGAELCLFTNQCNDPWQCKCSIPCLTQSQSFS